MSVNVAAGAAFIKGTSATYQGTYHVFNDAPVNLAIAASDPTNPRIDIVCAQIRDAAYLGGTNNDFRLVVVTGTPAGGPAAPATPPDSIVLAQIAVPAMATSVIAGYITDYRAYSSAWTAPRGTLPGGYAQSTTGQGSITTAVDITGLTVTVTVAAGRRIRISAFTLAFGSTVGTDTMVAAIFEGATKRQSANSAAGAFSAPVWVGIPTAGSHTYKIQGSRGGTGTGTWNAGPTSPSFILVEDIGV